MTWARVAIAAAALAAGCGAATETSGSFDDVRALLDAGGDVDWYVSSRIVFPEALAVSAQALRVFGSGGAALDGGGAPSSSRSAAGTSPFERRDARRRGVLDRTPIDTVAVNCAFADNFAYYGGAVAVAVSGTFAAAASTFDGNAAAFGAAFALYEAAAEPVVTVRLDNDTRVRNNRASLCGGAAMVIQRLAGDTGAALYLADRTRVTLRGCTFEDNAATVHGGAAALFGASKIVSRGANGFWGNDAGGRGGAFYLAEASEVKARHDAVAEAPAPSRAGRATRPARRRPRVRRAGFTTVGNATFVQSNKRVLGDAPSVSWSPSQGDQMAVIASTVAERRARGELIVDDAGDAYDSTTTTLTADVVVALDPCFPGETLVEASQHCERRGRTYWRGASLGAWDAGGACHECPRGSIARRRASRSAICASRAAGSASRRAPRSPTAARRHDGCAGVRNGTGDEALCADGYVGAVCGACERRHVASVDSRARLACAGCRLDVSWEVALLLLFFDTRGGAADDVTGMLHLDKNTPAPANEHDRKKQKFAALVVKAKALSSFFQLIASFQEAFGSGLQFPKTYASMQNAFSFATLGFFAYLPTRCFYDSSPAAHYGWSEEQRKKRGHFFFSAFLIMIHLALPSCAFTAVQTLVCDDFDAGDDGDVYFLRVAPTISCEGSSGAPSSAPTASS
ncbi:alpha-ketoglutarate-dependent dioxygenase alkB-like protein [Aureococcus anophagefferens]|nr:alpha-ketoglutarate-dependent dioxygenase alkB-like protein [Aureococcus anophagefferens]